MVKNVGFRVRLSRDKPRLRHLRKMIKLSKPQFPLLQNGNNNNNNNNPVTNNDQFHVVMNNKGMIHGKS